MRYEKSFERELIHDLGTRGRQISVVLEQAVFDAARRAAVRDQRPLSNYAALAIRRELERAGELPEGGAS
jgi:hypothetical protein